MAPARRIGATESGLSHAQPHHGGSGAVYILLTATRLLGGQAVFSLDIANFVLYMYFTRA